MGRELKDGGGGDCRFEMGFSVTNNPASELHEQFAKRMDELSCENRLTISAAVCQPGWFLLFLQIQK
jgi:hypothetical protein